MRTVSDIMRDPNLTVDQQRVLVADLLKTESPKSNSKSPLDDNALRTVNHLMQSIESKGAEIAQFDQTEARCRELATTLRQDVGKMATTTDLINGPDEQILHYVATQKRLELVNEFIGSYADRRLKLLSVLNHEFLTLHEVLQNARCLNGKGTPVWLNGSNQPSERVASAKAEIAKLLPK